MMGVGEGSFRLPDVGDVGGGDSRIPDCGDGEGGTKDLKSTKHGLKRSRHH